LPVLQLTSTFSICENDTPTVLNFISPINGTYSGLGVVNNTLNPALVGAPTAAINYSFVGTNGCLKDSTITVQVHAKTATQLLPVIACNSEDSVLLQALPSGGSFSGANTSSLGSFYSLNQQPATTYWYYTYVNANGC